MSPQQIFDTNYISAAEICKRLNCERITIFRFVKKGLLPEVIRIGSGKTAPCLFERKPAEKAISVILANNN